MSARSWLYRATYVAARCGPPALLRRLASHAADAAWRFQPACRRVVAANLSLLSGASVAPEAPMVRSVFRHFAETLLETFTMDRLREPRVTVEGLEHLLAAKESGRGMIALTGHLGNWELGAVVLRRFGVPIAAVALPHADRSLDRIFARQRARCGIRTISLGPRAGQQSLAYLREGCWLGLVGDLDVTGDVMASRLGAADVMLPRGPAVLALRARVPVLPMALIRDGHQAFRLIVEPAIRPMATAVTEAALHQMTDQCAAALTRLIRRAPDQWLVFTPIADAASRSERRPGADRAEARLV